MKVILPVLILIYVFTLAKGQTNAVVTTNTLKEFPPAVFANGIGDKWYSASDLEQIAKNDAKKKKINFDFTTVGRSVWIYTHSSNIIARVVFASDFGKPIYTADIDRTGKVVTNCVGIAVCGTGERK